MIRTLACILPLILTGCWQSEKREASAFEVSGELNGQPVILRIDGEASSVNKSGVDPAAVEALVSKAVGAAVSTGISPLIGAPKPAGFDSDLAGGLLVAAGGAGIALAKTLEARANRKDADEGWKLAHDNALKVPTA